VTPSLATAHRIVVKIGSALVVDQAQGAPRAEWLDSVAADIDALRARGTDVIVVSSGAIALARRTLNLTQKRLRLEEKQAAAAVGQIRLAQAWSQALSALGLTAAQLLLTLDGRPPPLPECARDAGHAAEPGLRAGDQRERHRRHGGNPLRRQRPPRRPGGGDGESRPADFAVRH
jgi:hypothetical protein